MIKINFSNTLLLLISIFLGNNNFLIAQEEFDKNFNIKLSPFVNVLDYGAMNDGSEPADDAFEAALTRAIGRKPDGKEMVHAVTSIYIPSGEYLLTKPIVIKNVQGLVIRTDGSINTLLVLSDTVQIQKGGVVQFYSCPYLNIMEGFKIRGENVWNGGAAAESGLSVDIDLETRNYCHNIKISRVIIQGLKCKYGIALGHHTKNYDLSEVHLYDCSVFGRFVPGETKDPNWYITGFKSGSGIGANILNHFYNHCIFADWKIAFHVDNMLTVRIDNASGSHAEVLMHVSGNISAIELNGGRMEGGLKLLTTSSHTIWPMHIAMRNYSFQPYIGRTLQDRKLIEFTHNGTLLLENMYLAPDAPNPNGTDEGYKIYCGDPTIKGTQVNVDINCMSSPNKTAASFFEPSSPTTKIYGTVRNTVYIGYGMRNGRKTDGALLEKINNEVWTHGL